MALADCFDPTSFPYQRAQTYVDANPPAVLSDDFYNPAQDSLARLFGALAGYSASAANDELVLPASFVGGVGPGPTTGDPFGQEFVVYTSTTQYDVGSITPALPGAHGVYQIRGFASGDRGAGSGFGVADGARYLGTMRWLFRARVRVNTYTTLANNGLTAGLGALAANQPMWIADGTSGYWQSYTDGGGNATVFPVVDAQWVTLWIGLKDADGVVRFYYQRDGVDLVPRLGDTETLMTTSLVNIKRTLRYIVNNTAVAADFLEVDSIGMICER